MYGRNLYGFGTYGAAEHLTGTATGSSTSTGTVTGTKAETATTTPVGAPIPWGPGNTRPKPQPRRVYIEDLVEEPRPELSGTVTGSNHTWGVVLGGTPAMRGHTSSTTRTNGRCRRGLVDYPQERDRLALIELLDA